MGRAALIELVAAIDAIFGATMRSELAIAINFDDLMELL